WRKRNGVAAFRARAAGAVRARLRRQGGLVPAGVAGIQSGAAPAPPLDRHAAGRSAARWFGSGRAGCDSGDRGCLSISRNWPVAGGGARMTARIRFGLLSFAHFHANFWADAINGSDKAELVGIWDDDVTRGQAAASKYGTQFVPDLAA